MTDLGIENVRAGSGSVVATFDCQLGGVRIVGARLVDGRNGRFLGLPSRKTPDGAGWVEVVTLSEGLRSRVLAAAVAGHRAALARHSQRPRSAPRA